MPNIHLARGPTGSHKILITLLICSVRLSVLPASSLHPWKSMEGEGM